MYLNPNYHIAEVMFRYNFNAITDSANENVYDSAITNATYAKLRSTYTSGLWKWNFDFIWAKANETASAGDARAWDHQDGIDFTPAADQEDDYGMEFDVSFDYQWNPNLVLSGFTAYYLFGDYYNCNNTGSPSDQKDQLALGMRLNLKF